MSKQLLFTVTIKDCDVETFRCPGHGGQNVNKVSSGVRIRHKASGAVSQSCDTRDQLRNKRIAFERMASTSTFKAWHKMETAKKLGKPSIEQLTEAAMSPKNLRVDVKDQSGRWVPEPDK